MLSLKPFYALEKRTRCYFPTTNWVSTAQVTPHNTNIRAVHIAFINYMSFLFCFVLVLVLFLFLFVLLLLLLFYSDFTARQYYFTHFKPSQSWGGAKTGDRREKQSDFPQAELGLSHMWSQLGSNPERWDNKRFRALKISVLNHSAMRPHLGFLCHLRNIIEQTNRSHK